MLMEGLWRKEVSKEIQEDDFNPLLLTFFSHEEKTILFRPKQSYNCFDD